MTRALLVTLALFGLVARASAQDAASEIQKAIDSGRQAAAAKDTKAYAAVLADDLVWMNDDGSGVIGKADRIKALTGNQPPTWTDVKIKVVGDTGIVTWVQTSLTTKVRSRGVRTYIRRGGRWLLLAHATRPL